MTRQEAQNRFKLAVEQKKQLLTQLKRDMTKKYEAETGLKANYFFAM